MSDPEPYMLQKLEDVKMNLLLRKAIIQKMLRKNGCLHVTHHLVMYLYLI